MTRACQHRRLRKPAHSYCLLLVLSALTATTAHAEPARGARRPLRYDLRIDVPVTVTVVGAGLTAALLKDSINPMHCNLCSPNGLDRSVRDALYWRGHRAAAGTTSDIIGLASLPALALGTTIFLGASPRADNPWWVDALIFSEAVTLGAGLNHGAKLLVARRRPFVNARTPAERVARSDADDDLSFYSGHASLAFSVVVAAGTLATLHRSPYARWVWSAGLPLAALTGYLRIAADKHYLTDVLTGAALGSAIGGLVPWLHRARPDLPTLSLGPTPASLALTWRLY